MGFYRHEDFLEDRTGVLPADADGEALHPSQAESEFEFFTRRALEEARLAQRASSPSAAAAHRYLAAAYSSRLAQLIDMDPELEQLALSIP